MAGASRPASEVSQVGRSAPKATPGNRLETAQQMAAHAKARAHRTLDRRNVEESGRQRRCREPMVVLFFVLALTGCAVATGAPTWVPVTGSHSAGPSSSP